MAGEEEGPAININLRITHSYVAVWQHDRMEIITNKQGNRMTSSYVAFTDNECLIGAAKNQVARSSTDFIFGTLLLHTFYSFLFSFFFLFLGNRSNIRVDELKKQIENMTSNIKYYMLPTLTNLLRIHGVVSFSIASNSST